MESSVDKKAQEVSIVHSNWSPVTCGYMLNHAALQMEHLRSSLKRMEENNAALTQAAEDAAKKLQEVRRNST